MAALDDAEAEAAEQHQHGRGDADLLRQIALDLQDEAWRRLPLRHALDRPLGGARARPSQPLAQQDRGADGSRSQVRFGPQLFCEASCTSHYTCSSILSF